MGELGESRMGALKKFMTYHQIGEDDFALESFYKNWQRWEKRFFEKKVQNEATKKPPIVLSVHSVCRPSKKIIIWTDVVAACNAFYHCGRENLILHDFETETVCGTFRKKYNPLQSLVYAQARQVMYYLIHEHCNLTARQIATLIPQSFQHIAKSISLVESHAILYESTREEIEAIERILGV